jgi:IS30 family transposase
MSPYRQLTQGQRYQIRVLLLARLSQTEIADIIGVHRSTISRELRRNSGCKSYRPRQAHGKALERRFAIPQRIKMTPSMIELIVHYICLDFSPEQVSGYLDRVYKIKISHETIYKYIWANKKYGGNLYKHLRQGHRKNRKRYGSKNQRGRMKDRVSIDLRPGIVDTRSRIGDWEVDTVTGKNSKGYLITAVERKSKLTLIKRVTDKQSDRMANAIVNLLRPYKDRILTITLDNGLEFTRHKRISKNLKADIYFAHPYHSWERGLNENTNGLIRQYFPKKMDFRKIDNNSIDLVMERLNNRPRKTLGFYTPNDAFFKYNNNNAVALMS